MSEETEGSVLTGNPEGSGESTQVWHAGLEDYKTETGDGNDISIIEAKGWKSNEDMLKSYINLERSVGADKVVLPAKDSNILEWEGWDQLGTPKDAADYLMAQPDGFEGYDAGLSDDMREVFHEAKLTPAQAQHIHDKFVERMGNSLTENQTATMQKSEQWEGELKKEYGTAFDERVEAARYAIREFGSPELQTALDQSGLGSHPELVRAFAKVGMQLGKGSQFKDAETSGNFGTTPEMAKEQIAALRRNPGLLDETNPENKVLKAKLQHLTELAYGTELAS
tara:strand:+ start:8970 stop:9815 length:846 start_codon:yes stop_codon:yes gene_type:complete